jgi:hypothetical protein
VWGIVEQTGTLNDQLNIEYLQQMRRPLLNFSVLIFVAQKRKEEKQCTDTTNHMNPYLAPYPKTE